MTKISYLVCLLNRLIYISLLGTEVLTSILNLNSSLHTVLNVYMFIEVLKFEKLKNVTTFVTGGTVFNLFYVFNDTRTGQSSSWKINTLYVYYTI